MLSGNSFFAVTNSTFKRDTGMSSRRRVITFNWIIIYPEPDSNKINRFSTNF